MRVVFVGNNSGGMYRFRKELIERIGESNEVYILTPFDTEVDSLRKIGRLIDTPLDRRGTNPFKEFKLIKLYSKIFNNVKPDLVITYTVKPNIYAGIVCRMKHIPFVSNITGLGSAFQKKGMTHALVKLLYRQSVRHAKVVFAENSSIKDFLIKNDLVSNEKIVVLNGAGVNLDYFYYMDYPSQSDETRFLFIGRIMKEKGIDELFEAMRRLTSDGFNCSLDVLGDFDEDYGSIIAQYQKEGWLRYHGYQNDVRPFIKDCYCFVLPSWHEGMANTNLECAACGRPIITSDIPGCREAVVEDSSGILCKWKNVDDLYCKMRKFIQLPFDHKKEYGNKGRIYMEGNFDKKMIVEQTIRSLLAYL